MDQDGTWYGGRPRPRPHCARWEPNSSSPKGGTALQFSAHVSYGQMAGRIKVPFGTKVGLGPCHIVTWRPSFPPKMGTVPNFQPMSIVAKSATADHLL